MILQGSRKRESVSKLKEISAFFADDGRRPRLINTFMYPFQYGELPTLPIRNIEVAMQFFFRRERKFDKELFRVVDFFCPNRNRTAAKVQRGTVPKRRQRFPPVVEASLHCRLKSNPKPSITFGDIPGQISFQKARHQLVTGRLALFPVMELFPRILKAELIAFGFFSIPVILGFLVLNE